MKRSEVWGHLREFALSLPGAYEDHPWGEVVAKVGKKVFVFLGNGQPGGMSVKLVDPLMHEHALSLDGSEPTGYGLGKSGWVSISFARKVPKVALLEEFIEESYRAVAPKKLVSELDGMPRFSSDA